MSGAHNPDYVLAWVKASTVASAATELAARASAASVAVNVGADDVWRSTAHKGALEALEAIERQAALIRVALVGEVASDES